MARAEIERQVIELFPINGTGMISKLTNFAIAIHDAAKEEDAKRCDKTFYDSEIAEKIRQSKVNP